MRLSFPVAIVGAACRLPGGGYDLQSLWNMLANGRDGVSVIPPERFDLFRFTHPDKRVPGRAYPRHAGLIDHIWDYDPAFFGISAAEAPYLDPQQRLALELVWEALEDAGIPPSAIAGSRTGVFFGASAMDMALLSARDRGTSGPRTMTGLSMSITANRVSYCLDLHGPSLVMDTACSSSLYALFHACQALAADDSIPLAIAGGVNELLSPDAFMGFSKASMLSATGRCATFDKDGDGYVRGEGGGAIILKRLDQAVSAGDRIHAVIRCCAINSDGRTNGISLPSREAQEDLLQEIYCSSDVHPDDLVYMEAHGTGTSAGDPVEANALGNVIGLHRSSELPIGSIKSNIGHLEPGAGMAGIMKAILILKHRTIPPNLHFTTPNPAIDFERLKLSVVTKPRRIASGGGPARIGVNSFAFGGSNAHAVLEEPPTGSERIADTSGNTPPLMISARCPQSLQALASRYALLLADGERSAYAQVAANALWHRDWLRHRLVIDGSPEEVAAALTAYAAGGELPRSCVQAEAIAESRPDGERPRTAFVFSGNGSQWQGMGTALLDADPVFAEAVQQVADVFADLGGIDILHELRCPAADSRMDDTRIAQPLLFAVQVGLTRSLQARGFSPDLVYGHSVGEAAAAWASGALSLHDAAAFIHYRGEYQAATRGTGAMLAANISRAEGQALSDRFEGRIEVAGDNAASSITLSGERDILETLADELRDQDIFAKMLPLDYPFHSRQMDVFRDQLLASLQGLRPQPSTIPFLSTVTGQVEPGESIDARYLWRNVREPVLFLDATRTALDSGVRLFLEIGPHGVLRYYLSEAIREAQVQGTALTTLQRGGDDVLLLDTAWKRAWASGWVPDMNRICPPPARRLDLPLYPWNRQTARLDPTELSLEDVTAGPVHPLLGWRSADRPVWENTLDTTQFPFLSDHQVMGQPLLPATAYVEMAAAAALEVFPEADCLELQHLFLLQSFPLGADQHRDTRVSFHESDGVITLDSRAHMAGDEWLRNMRCRVRQSRRHRPEPLTWRHRPAEFGPAVSVDELYDLIPQYGFRYGPSFAALTGIWRTGERCLASLDGTPGPAHENMLFSPALLDAALHLAFLYLHERAETRGVAFLPVSIARTTIFGTGRPAWIMFEVSRAGSSPNGGNITYYDENGDALLHMETVRLRTTDAIMTGTNIGPGHVERLRPAPHPARAAARTLPPASQLREALAAHPFSTDDFAREPEFSALIQAASVMALREVVESAFQGGETLPYRTLHNRLGVSDAMGHYAAFILQTLERHGMLDRQQDGCTLLPTDLPSFAEIWSGLLAEYAGHAEDLSLLGRIHMHLPQLLRGELTGASLLGSPSDRDIYQTRTVSGNPLTTMVGTILETLARSGPAGSRLRIVNAVPGGAALLESIVPRLEHLACDLTVLCEDGSECDALHAVWADKDFVTCERVDQYAGTPDAHCVLAVHAMHAENDIPGTLRTLFHSLHPGGMLLLAQNAPNIVDDVIYGSDPVWWRHSLCETEPVSPLLSREDWVSQLRQAGFEETEVLAELNGSYLLLARRLQPAENGPDDSGRPADGTWIVLTDKEPSQPAAAIAAGLRERFAASGLPFKTVTVGSGAADILLEDDTAWKTLWTDTPGPVRCLSLLGLSNTPDTTADAFDRYLLPQVTGAAQLARGWMAADEPSGGCWIVTLGAWSVPDAAAGVVPSQGAVWGLGRVLMNEAPKLQVRLVDLADDGEFDLDGLWRELTLPDSATESILSKGTRYTPRIEPLDLRPAPRPHERGTAGLRLEPGVQARLDQLSWRPVVLSSPGPGQLLVRNRAAGVNFRDIMLSLGLLPDEAFENGALGRTLGIEFSGVVVEVGPGVMDFAPGDEVSGIAAQSLATHVLAQASHVVLKPSRLTHEEAATLPTAFCTAWYAMVHLARLTHGESILIHGAAGGVGLAAIQIARHLGLTVHATAGSPAKRDFLRQLGIAHVYDSRSLAFADEIRAAQDGRGVDAVLNSLAGDAMLVSLDLLNPYGRFLELGKRDYFGDTSLGMRPLRRNISYFSIDIDALAGDKPDLVRDIFRQAWQLVDDEVIAPLPFRHFPAQAAEQAFRHMQKARHTGKLVLRLDTLPGSPSLHEQVRLDQGTWLVTGGTSGFGLETAAWLTTRGVRSLILLSRSGPGSAAATAKVDALRAGGISVKVVSADVTDATALDAAVNGALHDMPELTGILHAAAVLDDCLLPNLSPGRLAGVLRTKTLGAWNLHNLSLGRPVRFFVLFSSATTLVGNPGQGNYVAANMALETLAAARKRQGLPALTVSWGPIADVGMLTRAPETLDTLKKTLGMAELHSGKAHMHLQTLLEGRETVAAVFSADSKRVVRLPSAGARRFALLRAKNGDSPDVDASILQDLSTKSRDEALMILSGVICKVLASVLRMQEEHIRVDQPLATMGVDSLMSVELGLALESVLGEGAPHVTMSTTRSVADIAENIWAGVNGHTA